jgi:hypothetical protein
VQNWKEKDPKVVVDLLKDPNTQPSDNIIKLVCTPSVNNETQAIIEELLNPMIPVNVTGIEKAFKLNDLLQASQASRTLLLSLMWYHGWVTMTTPPTTDPSDQRKVFFCPPNELITGPLFDRLKERLQLNMDQIVKTIRSPTEETVKDLLWDVISKLGVTMDNNFTEAGLQAGLVGAFKATIGYKGLYTVEAECLLPAKGKKPDYAKRIDLILRYGNQVLLLELKRLQPRGIVVPGREGAFEKVDFPSVLEDFKESLPTESEALRDLKLSDYVQKTSKLPSGSRVRDLEKKAEEQARHYKDLLSKKDLSITSIQAFTVVQVGWPILVKEVI